MHVYNHSCVDYSSACDLTRTLNHADSQPLGCQQLVLWILCIYLTTYIIHRWTPHCAIYTLILTLLLQSGYYPRSVIQVIFLWQWCEWNYPLWTYFTWYPLTILTQEWNAWWLPYKQQFLEYYNWYYQQYEKPINTETPASHKSTVHADIFNDIFNWQHSKKSG